MEVTSKVGEFGSLFLKYLRKEETNMMTTMTSATYFKEKVLKIKPVSALPAQHFFIIICNTLYIIKSVKCRLIN